MKKKYDRFLVPAAELVKIQQQLDLAREQNTDEMFELEYSEFLTKFSLGDDATIRLAFTAGSQISIYARR